MEFPMIIRQALAFFLIFQLIGCSTHPVIGPTLQQSVEDQAALIAAQQEMLAIQSDQLEQMSANQMAMAFSLEQVKSQLELLQRSATEEKVAKPRVVKKPVETASTRKPNDSPEEVEPVAPAEGKLILGRNEWVWVDLVDQVLNARIDTGTRSSTLNAKEIEPFERNGESWVRFQLAGDDSGKSWEAPLTSYIRVRNSSENLDRRPVIKLSVRLGSLVEEAEFTLANRANMPYPLQLGRDFLRDIALVDVSKKFVQPKPESQTVAR
jgi:hypothetical protein